jgi:Pertussis toxin, subunit 1
VILRFWLLLVLVCVGALAPSRACAHGTENRTWGFLATATESRQEHEPQVADPQQANSLPGYETVSGCCLAAESEGLGFTFRGDARPPGTIFNEGFAARGDSTDLLAHALDNTRPPSAFISTSQSADVAATFSDQIYVVRPTGGINVNQALGPLSPFPTELEIAVPWRIPASNVRAVTLPNQGVSILNPNWHP